MTDNLEYLASLVHGRRSRMAEGGRLRALCQTREVADLAVPLLGHGVDGGALEIQRALLQRLADEIAELLTHLSGAGANCLLWLALRFDVENLKILVRRLVSGAAPESIQPALIALRVGLNLDLPTLAGAKSVDALVERLPRGPLREPLRAAINFYHEHAQPFFFEAALDRAYFHELLRHVEALPGAEGPLLKPVIVQEIDTFHLALVSRGKLGYGLDPAVLRRLQVPGTRITRDVFATMLEANDAQAVQACVLDRVVDPAADQGPGGPRVDPSLLERRAWSRFWRLANWVFRCSHLGLAAVAAYVQLRRVEVANLFTLTEGIRLGMAAEALAARLIPLGSMETAHV